MYYHLTLVVTLLLFKSLFSEVSISSPVLVENCENAIDDDQDGLIDINDPDCNCPELKPISRIPNPSFENYDCCPDGISQLNCAETWIQASGPTTDLLNTCGWMGWEDFPPPLPFPDGEGVVGFRDGRVLMDNSEPNWKEYAGACLLAPLKAGMEYRFEFHLGFTKDNSPPINITFFGNTNCNSLPFGEYNNLLGCPMNDTTNWIKLGSTRASGFFRWIKQGINVVPKQDIYAIAIGPDCVEHSRMKSTYYFFDNLILDEKRAFEFGIQSINHPCNDQIILEVPEREATSYQWFKDGVALVGQTMARLEYPSATGDYQVRIQNEEGCKITEIYRHFIPSFQQQVQEYICHDEVYQFGQQTIEEPGYYTEIFQTENSCDSLVELTLDVIEPITTKMEEKIFEGDAFVVGEEPIKGAGFHQRNLISTWGCDSLIDLHLSYFKVYIPNAFSPNGDGVNDKFSISGESDLLSIENLQVYNRWGQLLYDASGLIPNNPLEGWDGSANNEWLPEGIYVYSTRVQMKDGQKHTYSGELMLLR